MQWCEVRVTTEEPCVEAIAGLFHTWGAGGVIIEDPASVRGYIERGEWDAHGFSQEYLERNLVVVKAYYPAPCPLDQDQLDNLRNKAGISCHIDISTIQDEDWADNWKAFYHTTRVGKRLVIKPSWEEYAAQADDLIIELDPGMAFGTGTHITTRQCLELLEEIMAGGESVVDVGTGSGILATAAAKLGASHVWAMDIDPVAVDVAAENIKNNGVEKMISLTKSDIAEYTAPAADVLLANMTGVVIGNHL
ncbi:MAG: 50S ribosomal protein L11 methyltransferase, partial [Ignavibacteriales bacterium]